MLLEWSGRTSRSWLAMANFDLLQTAKQKEKFLQVLLLLYYHPETSDLAKIQSYAASSFGLTNWRCSKSMKCATAKGVGADRLGDMLLLWTTRRDTPAPGKEQSEFLKKNQQYIYASFPCSTLGNNELLPVFSKATSQIIYKYMSLSGLLDQTHAHGIRTLQMLSSKDMPLSSLNTHSWSQLLAFSFSQLLWLPKADYTQSHYVFNGWPCKNLNNNVWKRLPLLHEECDWEFSDFHFSVCNCRDKSLQRHYKLTVSRTWCFHHEN